MDIPDTLPYGTSSSTGSESQFNAATTTTTLPHHGLEGTLPNRTVVAEHYDTSIEFYSPPSLEHTSRDVNSLDYVTPVASPIIFSTSKVPNRKDVAESCQ